MSDAAAPTMPPEGNQPTDGMRDFQSIKRVLAGKITEVVPAGCYVENADGSAILRIFLPNMTARFQPSVGDYWIVYEDGYQALSPKAAFEGGYVPMSGESA